MKCLSAILFLCLITGAVSAQELFRGIFPAKEGKIYYTGVVAVDSTSKDELYRRARQWFVNTYKSASAVLQMDDKEAGQLIGKGYLTAIWKVTFYANEEVKVYHTIDIQIKDGKYRYEIIDFRVNYYVEPSQYGSGTTVDMPMEEWKKNGGKNSDVFLSNVNDQVKEMIESLAKAMNNKLVAEW